MQAATATLPVLRPQAAPPPRPRRVVPQAQLLLVPLGPRLSANGPAITIRFAHFRRFSPDFQTWPKPGYLPLFRQIWCPVYGRFNSSGAHSATYGGQAAFASKLFVPGRF